MLSNSFIHHTRKYASLSYCLVILTLVWRWGKFSYSNCVICIIIDELNGHSYTIKQTDEIFGVITEMASIFLEFFFIEYTTYLHMIHENKQAMQISGFCCISPILIIKTGQLSILDNFWVDECVLINYDKFC